MAPWICACERSTRRPRRTAAAIIAKVGDARGPRGFLGPAGEADRDLLAGLICAAIGSI